MKHSYVAVILAGWYQSSKNTFYVHRWRADLLGHTIRGVNRVFVNAVTSGHNQIACGISLENEPRTNESLDGLVCFSIGVLAIYSERGIHRGLIEPVCGLNLSPHRGGYQNSENQKRNRKYPHD
jgi:hypothetical protein